MLTSCVLTTVTDRDIVQTKHIPKGLLNQTVINILNKIKILYKNISIIVKIIKIFFTIEVYGKKLILLLEIHNIFLMLYKIK